MVEDYELGLKVEEKFNRKYTCRGIEDVGEVSQFHFVEVEIISKESPSKCFNNIWTLDKIVRVKKEKRDFREDEAMITKKDGKTKEGISHVLGESKMDKRHFNENIILCLVEIKENILK